MIFEMNRERQISNERGGDRRLSRSNNNSFKPSISFAERHLSPELVALAYQAKRVSDETLRENFTDVITGNMIVPHLEVLQVDIATKACAVYARPDGKNLRLGMATSNIDISTPSRIHGSRERAIHLKHSLRDFSNLVQREFYLHHLDAALKQGSIKTIYDDFGTKTNLNGGQVSDLLENTRNAKLKCVDRIKKIATNQDYSKVEVDEKELLESAKTGSQVSVTVSRGYTSPVIQIAASDEVVKAIEEQKEHRKNFNIAVAAGSAVEAAIISAIYFCGPNPVTPIATAANPENTTQAPTAGPEATNTPTIPDWPELSSNQIDQFIAENNETKVKDPVGFALPENGQVVFFIDEDGRNAGKIKIRDGQKWKDVYVGDAVDGLVVAVIYDPTPGDIGHTEDAFTFYLRPDDPSQKTTIVDYKDPETGKLYRFKLGPDNTPHFVKVNAVLAPIPEYLKVPNEINKNLPEGSAIVSDTYGIRILGEKEGRPNSVLFVYDEKQNQWREPIIQENVRGRDVSELTYSDTKYGNVEGLDFAIPITIAETSDIEAFNFKGVELTQEGADAMAFATLKTGWGIYRDIMGFKDVTYEDFIALVNHGLVIDTIDTSSGKRIFIDFRKGYFQVNTTSEDYLDRGLYNGKYKLTFETDESGKLFSATNAGLEPDLSENDIALRISTHILQLYRMTACASGPAACETIQFPDDFSDWVTPLGKGIYDYYQGSSDVKLVTVVK